MEYCLAAPLNEGEATRLLEPLAAPGVPGSLFHVHPGRVWMLFASTIPEGGAEVAGMTVMFTSLTPQGPPHPPPLTCRECRPAPGDAHGAERRWDDGRRAIIQRIAHGDCGL